MKLPKGTVKLWFDYLRLADAFGVEVDWSVYAAWGSRDELLTTTFNRWWTTRGRHLFDEDARHSPNVVVVEKSESEILVRIPLASPIEDIKQAISEIVLKSRVKRRIGSKGRFGATGQVNYKTLAQYKRYLEIDLKHGDEMTVAEKTAELVRLYEKIHAKGLKQRKTLRAKGKGSTANKFRTRNPEELNRAEIGGISPKRVSRWRLSGKHILLNVAEGQFPGGGYYGARLKERLSQRMRVRRRS